MLTHKAHGDNRKRRRPQAIATATAAVLAAAGFMGASACAVPNDATTPPPGATYDFAATLQQTVAGVIVPTYATLRDRASDLSGAAETLAAAPTNDTLEAARAAWIAARIPWEQSEGFLFGPVTDLGLDPSLDSWPVDRVQLDQVLASGLALSAESISANFGGGLRGFHTIEYLLWGGGNGKAATDFAGSERELDYLVAATAALNLDAVTLHDAWAGGDGYAASFAAAGSADGVFFRSVDAVQQLLNGMIEICNEVANGKIADPYKAQDRTLEESQFSHNSIQDFTDNIRSVRHIYDGSLEGVAADSIATFVAQQNADLAARLSSQIDAAIAAIYAISHDGQVFTDAITDPAKRSAIEAAQDAIRELMATLQRDVLPLIVN